MKQRLPPLIIPALFRFAVVFDDAIQQPSFFLGLPSKGSCRVGLPCTATVRKKAGTALEEHTWLEAMQSALGATRIRM